MDANYLAGLPYEPLENNRVTRVYFLLCLIGLLNVFDLWMTLIAIKNGVMFEANPIAEYVITNHGVIGISLYKFICIGISLALLAITRRHRISEWASVMGAATYSLVGVLWMLYPLCTLIAYG